jgi:hypothetical protein
MDRKGRIVFRGSLRFLFIVVGVSVQGACQSAVEAPSAPVAVSPAPAAQPVAPAPATQLADGIWTVQGPAIHGTRRCGDWLVRLTSAQGQLSGVVSHARSTVPAENLVLMPDGSFSGTTRASLSGSRRAPPSKVTGRFSGDTVSLTFDSERCPPRHGTAIRRAAGG